MNFQSVLFFSLGVSENFWNIYLSHRYLWLVEINSYLQVRRMRKERVGAHLAVPRKSRPRGSGHKYPQDQLLSPVYRNSRPQGLDKWGNRQLSPFVVYRLLLQIDVWKILGFYLLFLNLMLEKILDLILIFRWRKWGTESRLMSASKPSLGLRSSESLPSTFSSSLAHWWNSHGEFKGCFFKFSF